MAGFRLELNELPLRASQSAGALERFFGFCNFTRSFYIRTGVLKTVCAAVMCVGRCWVTAVIRLNLAN